MKKALVSIVISALSLTAPTSISGQTSPPPSNSGTTTIILIPKRPPTVKRSPGKTVIECTYSNGMLTFQPSDFYDVLTVTVSNLDKPEEWCEIVTDSDNTIILEEGYGYQISATTADGKTFTGFID